MKSFARYVILAPLAAVMAGPALAQNVPAGQSCGGLLCDMGMIGHKVPVGPDGQTIPDTPENHAMIVAATPPDPTHLPCHDFVCGMFGHRDDDAPPPAPAPVVAVAPAPEEAPAKPVHKAHRKHIAKAVPAAAAPAPAPSAAPDAAAK